MLHKKILKFLKKNQNYRYFLPLLNSDSPISYTNKSFINWCNNDYNRITQNEYLKNHAQNFINNYGIGAGGTRNISGTSPAHILLENKVSNLHKKNSGLIFSSGFLANFSAMESFSKIYPNADIFSDKDNHSSIIQGIKSSKLDKYIFIHNDMNHLENLLKKSKSNYKIIVIESIYSMDGSIAKLEDICFLKEKYNALTYIDEIHAVGVFGKTGAGITEMFNLQNNFDIIMGGFGKGFGTLGGYITGNKYIIDSIRCNSSGFIFTTSIPPHLALSTAKNIEFIQKNIEKYQLLRQKNVIYFKYLLNKYNIPYIRNNFKNSHIISIYVGDAKKCYNLSKILFEKYGHYVQPINYPTVPFGTERFRISINFDHTFKQMQKFITDLSYLLKLL